MTRGIRRLTFLPAAILVLSLVLPPLNARAQTVVPVPNPGFETVGSGADPVVGWHVGIGGGAEATITPDNAISHSGVRSMRFTNRSPLQAFVYALLSADVMSVRPNTTYVAHYWVRGEGVRGCYFGVSFQGGGEQRRYLPSGDYAWRQCTCLFTTPANCNRVSLRFGCDDVTSGLWVDDVSVEVAAQQQVDLPEPVYKKPFSGVFPRSQGPVALHLVVFDATRQPIEIRRALAALQGLVNRRRPRLYVLNAVDSPGDDLVWLHYMQETGYTGREERIDDWPRLVARFRSEITGAIVVDPDLPGSLHAAFMLAGLKQALPLSADMATALKLPIVMDLRGRWKHNVEAYRYVYDHYWSRMNHHLLAWEYPLADYQGARDYMVEFNVFTFWVSSYSDQERGGDPDAELAFLHEVLARTPANVPVMGWPMYGDTRGITEYEGVRLLSEYGKFVPGTEFCSNLSVHTALHPNDSLFRQKAHIAVPSALPLDPAKTYITLNILDSGDALWYWQRYQRKIWADPDRGALPIGWGMNPTLRDMMPLVMQWYFQHATPADTFFTSVSGLGYMNTQVYASRFRTQDRERIWKRYVALTDAYRRKADMQGIALYDGGWSESTPPSGLLPRFTHGSPGLDYIFADLGRHDTIRPADAATLQDGVPVFHTLTRYQVWSNSAEVSRQKEAESNAWLLQEIQSHTPPQHPGFMSIMAISWYYTPSWLKDLQSKLPPDYRVVSPADLAHLFRESMR